MSVVNTIRRHHKDERVEQALTCLGTLTPEDGQPGVTLKALAAAMGLKSLNRVRGHLLELKRQGRIVDVGSARKGGRSYWRLADSKASPTAESLEDNAALIDRLGGGRGVARLLGISRSAVSQWAYNPMPKHHRDALRRMAKMSAGERALAEAFAAAAPGEAIEYWRGRLASREAAPGTEPLADAKSAGCWARDMERGGRAILTQRRNGPDDYSYLAVKPAAESGVCHAG